MKILNLNKSFESKKVFNNFCCEFINGKVNYLMGESGIGKTTLLRIIAGLDKDYSGSVEKIEKISYVFQEPRLFPTLSAKENIEAVECGLKLSADEILDILELGEAKNLLPDEMSGGMKMRLSIARALYYNGDVFLMDEPFASIDSEMKNKLIPKILDLIHGKTVIIISHDENEARKYADNIVYIKNSVD